MYTWRKLTEEQREQVMLARARLKRPWQSPAFLKEVGREEAMRIWRAYPVDKYGEGWDK